MERNYFKTTCLTVTLGTRFMALLMGRNWQRWLTLPKRALMVSRKP